MMKYHIHSTFLIGILGLTVGLSGLFVNDAHSQLSLEVRSDIEQVLQSSIHEKEKEKLMSAILERAYQTDVPPQADSDSPMRNKQCFHQDVDITWDGAQKDKWGRNEIHGTEGNDVILGTDQDDLIIGHGGEDIICAGGGDDWVYGDGHEFNDSSGAFDLIDGEDGDDIIFGGGGGDWIHGSEGEDGLFGNWDNDHLFGGDQDDFLVGMMGTDVHYGDNGNDTINAKEFDDSVHDESYGNAGYDTCHVNLAEFNSLVLTFSCEIEVPH